MLHYYGDTLAMELGSSARFYIQLYTKKGESTCYVPFQDLATNKKRFVKFELLEGVLGWVFVGIVKTDN